MAIISVESIAVVAFAFGLVWLYVNVYTYGPVYRKAAMWLLGRSVDPRVYDEGTTLPDDELPTIDVLLPAYEERETIGHTIRTLRAADYPADSLRLTVLVESSDRTTRDELSRLRGRYDFTELAIPPSYPGEHNKPRALNYGFEHTDGELVGVVDAEDQVAPELFRQVVRALVDDEHDYVQGRLDMQNEDDGALNVLFRGEYGFWYGTVVPSFFRTGYPVPLGGTTNFATRAVLEAVAAERLERFGSPWTDAEREALTASGLRGVTPWDPRNVTEDFELGLLLWEHGRRMAMVTAVTREESPVGLNAWIRQRTRWQKGKLYTLVQRVRHPPAGIGRKVHVYTQSAIPHLGPVNIVAVLVVGIYAVLFGVLTSPVVAAVLLAGLALAIQQLVIHAVGYWTVTDERGSTRLLRTGLTVVGVPAYWALQWGADVRAFVQLAFGHRAWEKTAHAGRHLEADVVTPASSADGRLRSVVRETAAGWTWTLEAGDAVLARAGRTYPTESDARDGLDAFADALPVALGSGTAFRIARDGDGWTWTLVGEAAGLAVATEPAATTGACLERVGRVKTDAGTAVIANR